MRQESVTVEGDGNFVVAGNYTNHAPVPQDPPPGSGRVCAQCGDLNWVTKQKCKTCELDLFAYAAHGYHTRVIKRFWYFNAGLLVIGLIALFVANPLFKRWELSTASTVSSLVGLGCLILICMTLKQIEQHANARRRL